MHIPKLNFWGIQATEVLQTIQAAYAGHIIGMHLQGNHRYNISLTLSPELRRNTESITQLPIRTLAGKLINLGELVDIKHSGSRYFCESLFWASQPKQAAKT